MKKPWLRRWIFAATIALALAITGWTYRDWIIAQIYLRTLETEERVQALHIPRIVAALSLEDEQTVADIGAGTGLFSRVMARAVGPLGRVYAVDVNERLLAHIGERAHREAQRNLLTVLAEPDDPRIPEPVDLIFFCNTLHHIHSPDRYLQNLKRYLRFRGRIAVIDFSGDSPHIEPFHRFSLAELGDWMKDAGFVQIASYDFVEGNFFVIYECLECPEPDGRTSQSMCHDISREIECERSYSQSPIL